MVLEDYLPVKALGNGATGVVVLARGRNNAEQEASEAGAAGELFALKAFSRRSDEVLRRARNEEGILAKIVRDPPCPFLPTLHASFDHSDHRFLVLSYCPGGDLNSLRQSQPEKRFSPAAIRFYAAEILLALLHLHERGIVYRDLKPENILLSADGHVTLTDFDLSVSLKPKSELRQLPVPDVVLAKSPLETQHKRRTHGVRCLFICTKPNTTSRGPRCRIVPAVSSSSSSPSPSASPTSSPLALPSSHTKCGIPIEESEMSNASVGTQECGIASEESEMSNTFVGTEDYVAPEVILGTGHDFAVDWWGLGVLLYEMSYGRTPFTGLTTKDTFRNIVHMDAQFLGQPSPLQLLIQGLLAKDPAHRLGGHSLKSHSFFAGVQWDALPYVSRPPFIPLCSDPSTSTTGFDVNKHLAEVEFARAQECAKRKVAQLKKRA